MLIREKATPSDDSGTEKSPSNADDESQLPKAGESIPEDDRPNAHNIDQTTKSPPDSPVGSNAIESPSKELQDPRTSKNINVNGSPHAFETHGEYGALSGDKGFDEPGLGSFDTHYDTDAAWDFNPNSTKVFENALVFMVKYNML
ncbi:intersectin-1 [Forsythia ovata]|uniref:Intersectin-1 n=1 Tax=Forsythia ovata TaxID=205694 RepID=A0ABD1UAH4_9LAMI